VAKLVKRKLGLWFRHILGVESPFSRLFLLGYKPAVRQGTLTPYALVSNTQLAQFYFIFLEQSNLRMRIAKWVGKRLQTPPSPSRFKSGYAPYSDLLIVYSYLAGVAELVDALGLKILCPRGRAGFEFPAARYKTRQSKRFFITLWVFLLYEMNFC